MRSVSQRLLIFVTLLLLLFFGVMIALLDARFRKLSERSLTELLDAQMMALIASAEPDSQGLVVPRLQEDESRLNRTGSGLYAAVLLDDEQLWRSPSATGYVVDFGNGLAPGDRSFGYLRDTRGARLAALGRARLWENVSGVLTFVVATDMKPYDDQLSRFRKTLFRDFAVVAVLLLLALAATLRWLLAPLRRLAAQIGAVERGEREQLDDRWPTELSGVVSNLNTLLEAERVRIARYRDTLGNLAHSLKTPLAVLRTTFAPGAPGAAQVNEQVDRMSAIVEHQLRRAGTSGGTSVAKHAVDVLPIAQDLRGALLKVHGKKDFALEIVVPPEVQFVGDRDDLTEALGNLMDNAAKWCRSQVRVTASLQDGGTATQRLRIVVEDDGRGIAPADRTRVFERGARADEHTPGHGLGLAMVREMAGLYGGHLGLGESTLGGACLELRLPGRLR